MSVGYGSRVLVFGSLVHRDAMMSRFKRPIKRTARNPSWRIMPALSHKHGEPGCSHGSKNFKPFMVSEISISLESIQPTDGCQLGEKL